MKSYFFKVIRYDCLILLGIAFMFSCQNQMPANDGESTQIVVARQPAEYDAQEAIWLMWSPIDHHKNAFT